LNSRKVFQLETKNYKSAFNELKTLNPNEMAYTKINEEQDNYSIEILT